jgi:two-component system phosphate regulon sensor histidine kinase PhoR
MAGLNPKSNARPMAALVVFHDVTKVKSLEAMRREFLANVSHEFRTPLAIINGYIETLLDGALDDRQMAVKSLRTMQRNGRRLNLLIEDLLTVSRIEERAESLEFRYGDLHEVLLRVIESLEPTIRERGAVVEVAWPPSEREIEFDARRIDQVFSNLLENALRYGDPGSVILRVTAGVSDGWIRIAFKDNGPGIPYDDQPHIFDRFYRVHKDRSRDAGGTGLGLSIVKSVVHAHSGQVSVESTPGLGATFVVLLPVSQPAPSGEFAGE